MSSAVATRRAEEREEVHVLLEVGRLGEALGEGDAEQEREEHLHAGQGHAELVQELDQLPVQALLLALVGHGAYVRSFSASRNPVSAGSPIPG